MNNSGNKKTISSLLMISTLIILMMFSPGCTSKTNPPQSKQPLSFELSHQVFAAERTQAIQVGDLDGDGDLDAVIMSYEQPNQIWLNDGKGLFHYLGISLEDNNAIHGCAFGDFDGDGDVDFFLANFIDGPNQLWINQMISD